MIMVMVVVVMLHDIPFLAIPRIHCVLNRLMATRKGGGVGVDDGDGGDDGNDDGNSDNTRTM